MGTYNDVMAGIEKLRNNGINVIPSTVITPSFPELNVIVEHFIKLGFKDVYFNLARGKNKITGFSIDSINELIVSIKVIYEEIFLDFKENKISDKLIILRNSIIFAYLRNIYYKNYVTNRCKWGKSLVIDSNGNFYHCDSTIGYEKYYMGHYKDGKSLNKLQKIPNILKSKECKMCYAKFLCGGTCYAEKIMGNKRNENIECYFQKGLINENLHLYALLYKNSLLESFIKELS